MDYKEEYEKSQKENKRLNELFLEVMNEKAELNNQLWHLKKQLDGRVLGEYEQRLIAAAKGILSELNVK